MTGESVLELITGRQDRMRPSERKVAAAVLADPAAVVHMSMAGLADAAGVSEPTVMRFCTGLGFSGFQAFRLGLAQSLAVGIPVTHSAIEPDDPVEAMAGKIFDHTLSSLDRTRRSLDTAAVADAVETLVRATSVHFVGLGASGIIAQDALQHAVLFGVPCTAPVDLHQQYMAAAMCGPGEVVVAISNTGRTTSVLEVTERAKRAGAAVIAVTGGPGPLADLADVAIVLRTFEDTDIYTPTVSRLAGLVLVDVLATAVAVRRGPAHLERLREMKEALSAFRGSADGSRNVT
ncbi:RpiR family transcriptional regulator [Pseudonocardia hierapolitana]|uniref:RpiR family transcriptional regulator n=1 Tax=Pseudonocardia hierapolitana TaxID=1128676 RepID=A0A561SK88_9PSEU|nr:SIS domain-containing protein [Pseudonocardia hierapolitana]TWF75288.1 RpiR family transcriptional regulator [Pseudonocardia hierapolitana]